MRKRTKLIALSLLALSLSLLLADWTGEPTYRGVTLSEWLQNYRACLAVAGDFHVGDWLPQLPDVPGTEPPTAHAAAEAVRSIGPRAVPWLVRWISFRPTPWRTRLQNYAAKLPKWAQHNFLVARLYPDTELRRIDLALSGFGILGSNAIPAIPALAAVASDPTAPGSLHAIRALIEVGPPAVPTLTTLLNSSQPAHVKEGIRMGLGKIGPGASQAVAALLRDLKGPDMMAAGQSAAMLGRIGQQPDIVVPALIAALDDPRWHVRQCAAAALGHFGAAALPAVPKLKSLLGTVYLVDDAARRTLQEIAPQELIGVPEGKAPAHIQGFPSLEPHSLFP